MFKGFRVVGLGLGFMDSGLGFRVLTLQGGYTGVVIAGRVMDTGSLDFSPCEMIDALSPLCFTGSHTMIMMIGITTC